MVIHGRVSLWFIFTLNCEYETMKVLPNCSLYIYSNKFFHNFHLFRSQFYLSPASGKWVSMKTETALSDFSLVPLYWLCHVVRDLRKPYYQSHVSDLFSWIYYVVHFQSLNKHLHWGAKNLSYFWTVYLCVPRPPWGEKVSANQTLILLLSTVGNFAGENDDLPRVMIGDGW
jgi:hypothetical protein